MRFSGQHNSSLVPTGIKQEMTFKDCALKAPMCSAKTGEFMVVIRMDCGMNQQKFIKFCIELKFPIFF